jgi:hypothetical protein
VNVYINVENMCVCVNVCDMNVYVNMNVCVNVDMCVKRKGVYMCFLNVCL